MVLLKDVAFTFGLGAADEARLSAPDGALVDQAIWLDGEAPEGATWGRLPNGAGPFQALYAPTPGAANEAGVAPSICGDGVVDDGEACDDGDVEPGDGCDALCAFEPSRLWINEVVAAGADGGPDWIELYHHGLQPLDVSGWSVTDDSPESPDHRWTFADGIALAPMSHLVLTRDVEFLFGLGAADSVILYDASGLVVDQTSWLDGEAPIGQSWGRLPDGGDFQTLSAPTPGAPNLN
ncbi:lamin tail domain-containing protein [Myxococcota bacterium]|nr:lamin tail domain-containing protein [Myxococcota bacterium]